MKLELKKVLNNQFVSRLAENVDRSVVDLKKRFSSKITNLVFINSALVLFQFLYLRARYEYINNIVPFWYTNVWGETQLAGKNHLYYIPLTSLLITLVALAFVIPLKRYFVKNGLTLLVMATIASNLLLTYSLLRIIFIASVPFPPLIKPLHLELLTPALAAFFLVIYILPKFINYLSEIDIVTNPSLHKHPGMLLVNPTARGGGFFYGIAFLVLAVIFVGIPANLVAFYVALLLLSILGILDDYQNTHQESNLKFLESPTIRLVLLFLVVSIVSTLGAKIFSASLPFTGVVFFSSILSPIITTIWIVWVLNLLSWSNGIDGQYAGIVGVASVVIMLLALRFEILAPIHTHVATLAAISAGLSLGMIRFTWHPSKILWGFGAVSAGLVLSVLSILISSKIITSILIILIPFMDAVVTVVRRLMQGKNPLKADRGHLHHILLAKGWSIRRIAVSYWLLTAFFGYVGIITSERLTLQAGFTIVGIVAFAIVILNVGVLKNATPEKPVVE